MKIAVIGAGASGLLCGGLLGKNGDNVVIFEKGDKIGKKILITGHGRCNITNDCDIDEFISNVPRNPKFLYPALTMQSPRKTIEFFNNLGVKTKVEDKNKVFPKSDKASEVVEALYNLCINNGVKINCNEVVLDILGDEKVTGIITNKNTYTFDKVVVATGGNSYNITGSTGDGYRFAEKFEHKITDISGSLVGLVTSNNDTKECMGVSLKDIKISLVENNKKEVFKYKGDMIFTHFGISGPVVFRASSYMKDNKVYKIYLDFYDDKSVDELSHTLLKAFENNKNKSITNVLKDFLPNKIIGVILKKCNLDESTKINSITKDERNNLVENMKKFELPITQKRPINEATITRGGVSVKDINPKTMESKKVQNLYFIGEVLDVDGVTGGFNLQIAWSTAYLMANSLHTPST